ncbi:uncharacterized protein EI97DRAFT_374080 [Westerdykella ornata]|uniref:Uncharacterized protein n=1 Tax=Westerdykella ornata TaxID=318751 RepID=A0A6A6JS31_WESOR|nr:uncharacterized protein EI97DRAFT_374080 [Westerdykella ornata]KAF2277769.1 hypothetical protein EI97DRAFT_374080 [Westerdykella ornata]
MRSLTPFVLLAVAASVTAIPITPAAPKLQHLAEQMRFEGVAEHDIAEQLALSPETSEDLPGPLLSQLPFPLRSLFGAKAATAERDLTGDIAPGSLEAPQMLPRAAAPQSFIDRLKAKESSAYEGKESEMRRPWGMRHWDPVGYHWE